MKDILYGLVFLGLLGGLIYFAFYRSPTDSWLSPESARLPPAGEVENKQLAQVRLNADQLWSKHGTAAELADKQYVDMLAAQQLAEKAEKKLKGQRTTLERATAEVEKYDGFVKEEKIKNEHWSKMLAGAVTHRDKSV